MPDICPDCGRDLAAINNSVWAGYCHIKLGGRPFWDVCLPPLTKEELKRLEPIVRPMVDKLSKRMSETIDSILKDEENSKCLI